MGQMAYATVRHSRRLMFYLAMFQSILNLFMTTKTDFSRLFSHIKLIVTSVRVMTFNTFALGIRGVFVNFAALLGKFPLMTFHAQLTLFHGKK